MRRPHLSCFCGSISRGDAFARKILHIDTTPPAGVLIVVDLCVRVCCVFIKTRLRTKFLYLSRQSILCRAST